MIPWLHTKWGLLKKVQHGVKTGIKKSRPGRASHRIKKGAKTESKQGPKKSPKRVKQTVERNRKRVKHQSKLLQNASGIIRYLVSLI